MHVVTPLKTIKICCVNNQQIMIILIILQFSVTSTQIYCSDKINFLMSNLPM